MNEILKKWVLDSVKVDMQRTYRRQMDIPYGIDFIDRYSDYYVNLLTRLLNVLDNEDNEFTDEKKRFSELLTLAHGLQVFNENSHGMRFNGVNQNDNALYVSVLYYLCNYGAVACLLLRDCRFEELKTDAARSLYYVVSGGMDKKSIIDCGIEDYLFNGNTHNLTDHIATLLGKQKTLDYDSVDDFFDCQLLYHVLKKFREDNIRYDLYEVFPQLDWSDYIRYSVSKNIFNLLPSQRDAVKKGLLNFKRSFSLQMPTSAGKSFLTELLIFQELRMNPDAKVLYIAPLRSLSHELKVKYARISRSLGFSYRCIYGGSSISVTESILTDADLFITTPETLMTLEGAIENMLTMFSFVICDEGQLLESTTRGLNYELLLSRLKKNPSLRFLFISAIIPNIGDINSWLGGGAEEIGNSKFRPCTIRFASAYEVDGGIGIDVYEDLNKNSLFSIPSFISKEECKGVVLKTKKNIASLLALKSLDAGSTMLFTSFKRGNAGCAEYGKCVEQIIKKERLQSPKSFLDERNRNFLELIDEYVTFQYGNDYMLSRYIKLGFAIHHASLPQDIRELFETGFSGESIRLLICNSTLAEGVNFPIKTLVLGDIRHPGSSGKNGKLMDKEVLMNVIGRAGRAGEETYGLVISLKDKFGYVIDAAKGNGLVDAKGMLNDIVCNIVNYENNNGRELTESEMNDVIEGMQLSDSIDRSIILSVDDFKFDSVDPDEISTSSLSYHLSSQKEKSGLKRMFRARFNYLRKMDATEFAQYKDTQLPISTLAGFKDIISDNDRAFVTVSLEEFCNSEWLLKMFSYTKLIKESRNIDQMIQILLLWQDGKRYVDISNSLDIPVDDVAVSIDWLTKDFLLLSKSIIRYFCQRFNIENDALSFWPICVERGLNSTLQCELFKKGLFDRYALHCVDEFVEKDGISRFDINICISELKTHKNELLNYASCKGLPKIAFNRIESFVS